MPRTIAVADAIHDYNSEDIAETLGVSTRTVQRWRVNGVNAIVADKIAIKVLGEHPVYVWGADWTNLDD